MLPVVRTGLPPADPALQIQLPNTRPCEEAIAATYYGVDVSAPVNDEMRLERLIAYCRPIFRNVFSVVRRCSAQPLPALEHWPLNAMEKRDYSRRMEEYPLATADGLKIDWTVRLKNLANCPYLQMKYTQLLCWIITEKMVTGLQLGRSGRDGTCPFCHTTADAKHMFLHCPATKHFWEKVNDMGQTFWPDYIPFSWPDITSIAAGYEPSNLMKMSALWALWLQWNDLFYNREEFTPEREEGWLSECMMRLKVELLHTAREAKPVIQWLTVLADRRLRPIGPDGQDEQHVGRVPEKKFLLTEALSINTKPVITLPDTECEDTRRLLGNNVLLYRTRNKITFNHSLWLEYVPPPAEPDLGESDQGILPNGVDILGILAINFSLNKL